MKTENVRNPANSIKSFLIQITNPTGTSDHVVHGYSFDDILLDVGEALPVGWKITHILDKESGKQESYVESA